MFPLSLIFSQLNWTAKGRTMASLPTAMQCSHLLRALDLHDFDRMCLKHLSCYAPKIKLALMSLEILAIECKNLTDRNGVEYDLYPLFQFLKELQASLPLEMDSVALLTKIKYLYFKRNLLNVLKGNLLNFYLDRVKKLLKAPSRSDLEITLWKVVTVMKILKIQPEISNEDIHLYEFLSNALKLCYEENVQDSRLVVALLTHTIAMHSVELSDTRSVLQPLYPNDFYKYLLKISLREKFDLPAYCRSHPNTLWEYSEIFSVTGAVSFGNYDRVLSLLQHGVEVFPSNDAMKSGHGFPDIQEVIPKDLRMVLFMMFRIRSMNLLLLSNLEVFDQGLYSVTHDQKRCFELVWGAIPAPFAKHIELANSISDEYFQLAIHHRVFNPMRYEKNIRFCSMYNACFEELASGPTEPRSLMHLSKCAIRERLKHNWNLPEGIKRLGLPFILQKYLNLEYQ